MKESKDSKIKGVIANFGKKDVDIEKQIELLELDIIDTKKLEDEIKQLIKIFVLKLIRYMTIKKEIFQYKKSQFLKLIKKLSYYIMKMLKKQKRLKIMKKN